MIFTQFLDYVARTWSEKMVDDILADCRLESGRADIPAHTALGNYDHEEIILLAGALAARTGETQEALISGFGRHLGQRIAQIFPLFFSERRGLFAAAGDSDNPGGNDIQYPHAFGAEAGHPLDALAIGLVHGAADHLEHADHFKGAGRFDDNAAISVDACDGSFPEPTIGQLQ